MEQVADASCANLIAALLDVDLKPVQPILEIWTIGT